MAIGFATPGRRRRPAPCLRAARLALALVLAPALAVAQPAAIVGDVSLGQRGNPLAGITVVLEWDHGPDRTYTTDGSGTFSFTNLTADTYYLYTRNDLGYTNEAFDDILCLGRGMRLRGLQCGSRPGRPIVLSPGMLFSASVVLDLGGVISGTVTAAPTLAPLAGANVILYGLDRSDPGAEIEAEALTDAGGNYRFQGLPAGRYYVMTRNGLGYADELTDDVPCPGGACYWALWSGAGTPVELALGAVAQRSFALDPGARVTGTITEAGSGTPLSGACVSILRVLAGQVLMAGGDCSDGTGAYDVGALPGGTYYAWARSDTSGHIPELYDDIACLLETCLRLPASVASGVPIVLGVGAVASGKDFALTPGGGIRGHVRDAATGAPVANQYVSLVTRVAGAAVHVGSSATDAAGAYAISGLPSGTYYAYTDDHGYTGLVFDQIPCSGEICSRSDLSTVGTPIAVTTGMLTPAIDFGLRRNVPPPAPRWLSATVVNYVVTLSWNRPLPWPHPVTFILEAGLSPGTTLGAVPTASESFTVSPVGPGRYYVRVRATNAYGVSEASDEIAVVVRADGGDGSPPAAPGYLSGWMSGARLTLVWGTPTVGGPPERYLLEVGLATGQTLASLVVPGPAFTFQPVPDGVYFLRVRSMNAAGISPPSHEVRLHVGAVPSPPYAPWLWDPLVVGGTVTLEWMSPPWQGTVTGHLVTVGSAPGLANLGQANVGNTTTLVVPGVPPGTYYVRVHAVNAAGASIASDEVKVVVR